MSNNEKIIKSFT